MKVLNRGEADRLSELIVQKLDGAANPALDEFIKHRFAAPLRANAWSGPWYGRAFTAISVTTIAAGLASSALAAADQPRTTLIAVLGLAIGVLTAVNQLWKPAQRSVARYQAAYALRREGWDFINDRGRYERVGPDKRVALFLDEVSKAHRGVEAIDEEVAEAANQQAAS